MMDIIITMAGNGRRFREAGYDLPKYQISAHGRTLFEWSMLSLANFWQAGARATFVTQREHDAAEFIHRHAARCGITSVSIVELDALTAGQATTALAAAAAVEDRTQPMAVFNIDTYVHPSHLRPQDVRGQGWIPCFPGAGDGWSFAKVDESLRVLEVREKVRISPWATIGLYYFDSFARYQSLYEEHFAKADGMEKGERYIAPMYNTLLEQQRDVYIACLPPDAIIPMGTPAELNAFIDREPPAEQLA
ncbi:MAG: hypothetical protein EOP38_06365 [Rubrivivax sp.]|nr:MAG: hypothetical protein EOP38_06365 [Rubrivivax sp.]